MKTKILSVGTNVPGVRFTQDEAARILKVKGDKALRFFKHPHISTRHLLFPEDFKTGAGFAEETPEQLREKFLNNALTLTETAIEKALANAGLKKTDIHYIACVTSTAFIVPGLSALLIEHLKLPRNTQRVDIVGMGCNAGLNGMNTVSSWSKAHPGKNALLICCELSSCIYTVDEEENTALVNSLFGDGISVAVIRTDHAESPETPEIVQFQSYMIPDSLECLRFNYAGDRNRYNFYVDKKTPSNLAASIMEPLQLLLQENKLKMEDIKYWVLHTGGDAILSGIEKKLALSPTALRHTRSVLKDYGNISSGSFLFSYARLMEEKPAPGYGMMITMGPGLTIETALLKWP